MAMEMTIPDFHNQRRLPTNSTTSLWEDRAVLYNESNMEKPEDEEEEKGTKRPRQSSEAHESQMDDVKG